IKETLANDPPDHPDVTVEGLKKTLDTLAQDHLESTRKAAEHAAKSTNIPTGADASLISSSIGMEEGFEGALKLYATSLQLTDLRQLREDNLRLDLEALTSNGRRWRETSGLWQMGPYGYWEFRKSLEGPWKLWYRWNSSEIYAVFRQSEPNALYWRDLCKAHPH